MKMFAALIAALGLMLMSLAPLYSQQDQDAILASEKLVNVSLIDIALKIPGYLSRH